MQARVTATRQATQHDAGAIRPSTQLAAEQPGTFADHRPGAAAALQLRQIIAASPQVAQARVLQAMMNGGVQARATRAIRKPRHEGLSDRLKSGIEQLSGISMDHVKVHYNSSQPARLQAHAYAQGSEIHVAPGQERHLPHEAWHVVQQAQGRVKPTRQMKGGVALNDDARLEAEADTMGAKALTAGQRPRQGAAGSLQVPSATAQLRPASQPPGKAVAQRFASAASAQAWIAKADPQLTATPARASRMRGPIAEFEDAVASWQTYGEVWQIPVTQLKEELKDNYSRTLKLEALETHIQALLTASHAANAPLKTVHPLMTTASWLNSYATPQQKTRMAAIHANLHVASAGHDQAGASLAAILQTVRNMTDVSNNVDPFIAATRQQINNLPLVAQHDPVLKTEGDDLTVTLTTAAGDSIDALLVAAHTHATSLLDVDAGKFEPIKDKFIAAKLPQAFVQARIAGALALQHAPVKDIWLRKVVGLTSGLNGAYLKGATAIHGIATHVTRYADAISAAPSVNTGGAALKNDVLGSGVTGYHCTVETQELSASQPHAYRGGITLLRWAQNSQYFPGVPENVVETALNAEISARVASAELRIDGAIANKGAGLQKGAVEKKLADG